jgi:hypothetical protein
MATFNMTEQSKFINFSKGLIRAYKQEEAKEIRDAIFMHGMNITVEQVQAVLLQQTLMEKE